MAILQISIIQSDTRWAKEVRLFGIPVYLERELDVRTKKEDKSKKIGFQQIGDTALLDVGDEDDS